MQLGGSSQSFSSAHNGLRVVEDNDSPSQITRNPNQAPKSLVIVVRVHISDGDDVQYCRSAHWHSTSWERFTSEFYG